MSVLTKRHWKLQEFVAHSANVNCLSLGRKSGRVMVTGGDDKKVNLWAVGKPHSIMSLPGHTTPVECVRFDPREVMVCAGSMSGALKVWDLEAAKIIRTLTGHKANVRCLDFHPYGDFMASGSLDTSIKLWDARKKGCIYSYKGHNKAVNTLKFSPDGKWVASGGEDGSVKLWDLSAGKLLTEFCAHTSFISDVEFHPNEFLLASGSADRTVKFWDLESFQMVSTTEGDTMPIRCLYFHTSGSCLFSGSQDVLKVYGWEPNSTFDTVIAGWGKVADIAMSQNQLIGGSFLMNSVSVYIIQLSTLSPFYQMDNDSDSYISPQQLSSNVHVRKSFLKESSGKKISSDDVKIVDEPCNPDDDAENDNLGFNEVEIIDSEEVFLPRSELCRTPPKNDPFPDPLDDPEFSSHGNVLIKDIVSEIKTVPIDRHTTFSITEVPEKLVSTVNIGSPSKNSNTIVGSPIKTYPIPSSPIKNSFSVPGSPIKNTYTTPPVSIKAPYKPMIPPQPSSAPSCQPTYSTSYSSIPDVLCQTFTVPDYHSMQLHTKPMEKATAMRRQMQYPPEAVVRPTTYIPEKEGAPQRAVVYPEQLKPKILASEFVPEQRDKPAGLDVDEFLPKTMQGSLGITEAFQPEMSEAEAMNMICRENQPLLSIFDHRNKKLRIILALLKSKDHKIAVDTAVHMNDQAILVDILSNLNRRPELWNLDICQMLLPSIQDLIQSKYEIYMSTGCEALRLILRRFGSLIKTNVDAPPSIGVDLCGEERVTKCKSCYEQLLGIRSFILKRQTMQGKLGQSFRELLTMMCSDFSRV